MDMTERDAGMLLLVPLLASPDGADYRSELRVVVVVADAG
jgi:hypothetical protein